MPDSPRKNTGASPDKYLYPVPQKNFEQPQTLVLKGLEDMSAY